jgi:hypothetical protein
MFRDYEVRRVNNVLYSIQLCNQDVICTCSFLEPFQNIMVNEARNFAILAESNNEKGPTLQAGRHHSITGS